MKDGICPSAELWGTRQGVGATVLGQKELCPGQVSGGTVFSVQFLQGYLSIGAQCLPISFPPGEPKMFYEISPNLNVGSPFTMKAPQTSERTVQA